uniref:3CxxC-type domain-containing protein n=1 Tax=Neovison vison TaxID=452646 RepID=A0A8C7BXI6_NEOVI
LLFPISTRWMFQELIQEVKPWHKWTLTEDKDLLPNSLEPGWSQYQQWAFARFQCSLCSRSWASSQVQVVFHMHKTGGKPRGNVKMRVFAQRCQKCHQSPFEVPEFTKENISRILNNLVFRILKKCYREGFKPMEEIPTIREITLEGPHDSNNCEACLQGFCAQSGFSEAVQSPVSPSLPAISSPPLETTIPMPFPSRSDTTVDTVKGNITADDSGNGNYVNLHPPQHSISEHVSFPFRSSERFKRCTEAGRKGGKEGKDRN